MYERSFLALARKKMRGLSFGLALVIFLCPILNEPPSHSRDKVLAPSSRLARSPSSGEDTLYWFRFAETSAAASRVRPETQQIHQEWKQLGKSFVLDESGEDRVRAKDLEPADLSPIDGELYVISDVHLSGSLWGGLDPWKYRRFLQFLNAVIRHNGTLVINGDFLELYINKMFLWRNLETVYRKLRKIKRVVLIVGNHEEELGQLAGKRWRNITILDSMSLEANGKLIRIEHGHLSDWPWHHDGRGGVVIKWVHWLEDLGIPVRLHYIRVASWVKFFFFPIRIVQFFLLDRRIRALRSQLELSQGPYRGIRNFLWELFAKKEGPFLHYVIGHYHELDLWMFGGLMFRLTRFFQTRVKLHFTAGRWEPMLVRMPLLYTFIDRRGTIERLKVEDFIREDEDSRDLPEELQPLPPVKPSRRLAISNANAINSSL